MLDTASILADADEMLRESGGVVTVHSLDDTYNFITPSASARQVTATQSLNAVQLAANRSRVGKFDKNAMDGLKLSDVRFFYVSPVGSTFQPAPGHIIEPLSGDVMTIKGVNVLEPSGVALLYEILAVSGAPNYTFSSTTEENIGLDGYGDGDYLTDEDDNPLLFN